MNCIDCPKASECHNVILNDMQLVEFIRGALDNNRIEMAKEELTMYMNRLRDRNKEITGR